MVKTSAETPTIVFTNNEDHNKIEKLKKAGVTVVESEKGGRDLARVLDQLKNLNIQSVLVEGGAEVAGAFCEAKLADKITFLVAPIVIGGPNAPVHRRASRATRPRSPPPSRYCHNFVRFGYRDHRVSGL